MEEEGERIIEEENENVEVSETDDVDTLKAQVVSDLHLEMGGVFGEVEDLIPVNGNVLILPGDIGILGKEDFFTFFEWTSKNFKHVLYVPDYHNVYNSVINDMREKLKPLGNVHLLYRSSVVIGGIRFLGTTFWTHPPNKQRQDMVYYRYNDYRHIKISSDEIENEEEEEGEEGEGEEKKEKTRFLTIYDTMKFHQKDKKWMESEIEKARKNKEIVYIITHHVPLLGLKFLWTGERNLINRDIWYGNCTDESQFIYDNMDVVKCWFYGHTHKSLITTFGCGDIKNKKLIKKRRGEETEEEEEELIWIISNQVGYKDGRDESDYDKDLVLSLPLEPPKEKKVYEPKIILDDEDFEIWGEVEKEEEEVKKPTKVEHEKKSQSKKKSGDKCLIL